MITDYIIKFFILSKYSYQNLNLTRGQRRKIGYQAKMILDQARAKYVEKCGLKCNLTTFANEEDTLENILLHAER